MERLEEHRRDLLLEILELIHSGQIRGSRFGAAEVRTSGNVMLILFNHEGGGRQPKLQGYLESDLEALASAGFLEVGRHGNSLDVLVLQSAHDYTQRLGEPRIKSAVRRVVQLPPVQRASLFVLSATALLILRAALEPWLRSIFGQ